MMADQQITDSDLAPGESCPECGEEIKTWRARQLTDPENLRDAHCWLSTDNVEPTGLTNSFAGNTIVIRHA